MINRLNLTSLPMTLCLQLVPLFASSAAAQDAARTAEEMEVVRVVVQLFDGMRAGDTAAVRSTFAPDARLVGTSGRGGEPALESISADRFVEIVGRPHDEVWDEQIFDTEVRIDGSLATVWTQYVFYIGDDISHCGVDAFQLFRGPDGWKIFHLADTRRREGCEMPG